MNLWPSISSRLLNPKLVTLGFGIGVQSTTMALMAKHGELGPMPTAAIVSDTMVEPQEVYDHLRFMQSANIALPFPIEKVSRGHLGDDVLASAATWTALGGASAPRDLWRTAARIATPPFFTRGPRTIERTIVLDPLPLLDMPGGEVEVIVQHLTERESFGMLRRQCTREYKIEPVTAAIRQMLGLAKGQPGPRAPIVEHWIGLTTDEMERVATSNVPFIHLRHPLIELGMSRGDCIQWLRRHGYPIPPKSRCIFCPYQSDELWLDMKIRAPEEFEQACVIDRAIRHGVRASQHQLFLHESRIPLEEVDFTRAPGIWSREGFRNECEGVCGL